MFVSRFNTSKCETTCRLCIGRIKLIRNKKTLALKQSQKDIAEQLRNGKQEYARIRVEGVIREKLLLQAFEILELYLELLTVRTQLIAKTKELPRDMMEAVSSIIYAAQRINDLPELAALRTLFATKYGKEYAGEAAADATASRWQVNGNLIRCLLVEAPQPEEKLAMLSEIAQEHGVEWDLAAAARDMGVGAPGSVPPAPLVPAGLSGEVAPVPAAGHYGGQGGVPPTAAMPAAGMPVAHGPAAALAQYANAHQAAQAAAAAAAQAQAAAQYAAQIAAMAPPGAHLPPGGSGGGAMQQAWLPHIAPIANGDGMPPSGAFAMPHPAAAPPLPPPANGVAGFAAGGPPAAFARSTPSPPPLPPHNDDAPPPPGGANRSGGGGGNVSGGYIVRSDSEIQRDYDAALGPPAKGAPAAPPEQPAPAAQPVAQLPPPTHQDAKAAPSAPPPPPPQAEDEYEELTRRLEALKRKD